MNRNRPLEVIVGGAEIALGTALMFTSGLPFLGAAVENLRQGDYRSAAINSLLPLLYLSLVEEGEALMVHGCPRLFKSLYGGRW